jgi:hypothetical protein
MVRVVLQRRELDNEQAHGTVRFDVSAYILEIHEV